MCAGSMQHEVSGLQLKRSECRVPVDDPERFRLEIMFSSGAQHNPYQHRPLMSHTMSISPREMLHKGVALRPRVQCSMFGMWLKIRRSVPLLACMIGCPSPASCLEPSSLLPQTAGCCCSTIHSLQLHACVHAAALHVGPGPPAVPAYHTSLLLLCRGWLVLAGCGGAPEPCGHPSKVCYSAEPKFGACPGLSLCR